MASNMQASRTHVTLEEKYKIILELEGGAKQVAVCDKYGHKKRTVSTWWKKRACIKEEFESGSTNSKAKTLKTGKFPKTEAALCRWIQEARAANIDLSGPFIRIQAEELAKEVGEAGFTASNGWYDRFKKRNAVIFKIVCGEANGVDQVTVDDFRSTTGVTFPQRYSPEDIFNVDEAGLVWEAQSGKTFTFKGDKSNGKKKPKQRVTILPCANMTGTEKKRLLVIGKSENPRAFRGRKDKLKVQWKANKNAWMTSEFFTEWLVQWNRKLSIKKRKIALVLDNATCHPKLELSNIELVFLPANTTSHTQPLDQGIIANLKCKYRHEYALGHLIPALNAGKNPAYTIFDALEVLRKSWDQATPRTIARCFRKAGFKHPDIQEPTPEDMEEEELPLSQLAERLSSAGIACDTEGARLALTEDEDLQTSAVRSNEEIAREVLTSDQESDHESDTDEPDDSPGPVPKPTHKEFLEALEHLKVIQTYASYSSGPVMEELYNLSSKMHSMGVHYEPPKQQTTLDKYFSVL